MQEQGERKWPWRAGLGFRVAMADDEDNASSVLDADTFIETESPEVIIARIEGKSRQVERLLRIPHYTEALETALMDAGTFQCPFQCEAHSYECSPFLRFQEQVHCKTIDLGLAGVVI